jgi:hypothetical protein
MAFLPKCRFKWNTDNLSLAVRVQRQCDGPRGDAPRGEPDERGGAEAVHGERDGAPRAPPLVARQTGLPLPPEHWPLLHAGPGGHCHAGPTPLLCHEVKNKYNFHMVHIPTI